MILWMDIRGLTDDIIKLFWNMVMLQTKLKGKAHTVR